MGIVAVVVLAAIAMVFYGAGGEAPAVAVLGATLGTIGSIVGAVVGVAMGTKSGGAAGDANTKSARSVAKRAKTALASVKAAHEDPPQGGPAQHDTTNAVVESALRQVDDALADFE